MIKEGWWALAVRQAQCKSKAHNEKDRTKPHSDQIMHATLDVVEMKAFRNSLNERYLTFLQDSSVEGILHRRLQSSS